MLQGVGSGDALARVSSGTCLALGHGSSGVSPSGVSSGLALLLLGSGTHILRVTRDSAFLG